MNTTTQRGLLESTVAASSERLGEPTSSPPERRRLLIQQGGSNLAHRLAELWDYRELLYFMAWRDVKVRYKQTAIGVAWVVIQPLLTTLIFTIFLGMLARVPSQGRSYPLFVYAALLPWTFFSGALLSGGVSLVGNTHLITKIYFPRLIIPAASVLARMLDFMIGFGPLVVMMVIYRAPLTTHLLMLPILTVLTALLAFGFSTIAAATNVRFRDVGMALPVLVQLWLFASPVVYPSLLVPASWRKLYMLNPIVGIVDNFRAAIFGTAFDWDALGVSVAVTTFLLIVSAYWFGRVERTIADVI